MIFTIYAYRERGSQEVRYIGQTSRTPNARLAYERGQSRIRIRRNFLRETVFDIWLAGNDVEAVPLITVETRPDALAKEREMIVAFCKLGHRLFNCKLVPAEYRQAA